MPNDVMKLSYENVLIDGISDMVFVMSVKKDLVFTYEFLNKAAMKHMNLTNDIIGKSFEEVFPGEHGERLTNYYQQVVETKASLTYEDSYVADTGKTKFSKTELIPFFDSQGICTQIVGTIKDITKEKRERLSKEKAWKKLTESYKRYESLFDNNSDAILSTNLEGNIIGANPAVKELTGHAPYRLMGASIQTIFPIANLEKAQIYIDEAKRGIPKECQTQVLHKQQREINVSLKITPLIMDDQVVGIYFTIRDMTESLLSKQHLHESEQRFRAITENANDLITLLDEKGKIIYASPSYEKILGLNPDAFIGHDFSYNIAASYRSSLDKEIKRSIKESNDFKVQFEQFNKERALIWCEAHGTPVFDENQRLKRMVVITRDIHYQKEVEKRLNYDAHHDPVTGLPNRNYFHQTFQGILETHSQSKHGLGLFMLDIDCFKDINDSMGHDAGDQVITEFGKRIKKAVRTEDTVARFGGDEFMVIVPRLDSKEDVLLIGERMFQSLEEEWKINGHSFHVTASIGATTAPFKKAVIDSMIMKADAALYQAKDAGKNTLRYLDYEQDGEAHF